MAKPAREPEEARQLVRLRRVVRTIGALALIDPEEPNAVLKRRAWRMFFEAARQMRAPRLDPSSLSSEARTALIFARYGPAPARPIKHASSTVVDIAPTAGVIGPRERSETAGVSAGMPDDEVAAYVLSQRKGVASVEVTEAEPASDFEWGPLPGRFPARMGWRRKKKPPREEFE